MLRLLVLLASADGQGVADNARHEALSLHDLQELQLLLRLLAHLASADGQEVAGKPRHEALAWHDLQELHRLLRLVVPFIKRLRPRLGKDV